jgi:SAM-dependent methyltransferase
MKKLRSANPVSRSEFLKWYHVASSGQALQALESTYLKSKLNMAYGEKALQVGRLGSESLFVDPDFIGDYALIDNKGPRSFPTFVQGSAAALPVASEAIDTVILPHVLEFVPDRHQVLREVERVLKPEGRLFIFGLNPWSPRRLLKLTDADSFWNARLIAGHHLLDWLSLLKFDAELVAAFDNSREKSLQNPQGGWEEFKAGLSMAYVIKAIKRNYTLIPIEPEWAGITQLVTGKWLETPQLNRGNADP